ncbi:hypothetical protein DM82_2316 [Burkholderia oklahomensis]|uniref:Uncharacterized protein n=1 Tax=Burkholderia oklahomensis TaxID=342113 RepID=A0AAI8FNX4_9BURK|nr:hypothetical protein DM82_2316 [Burkholderia oklahomensis]
MLQDTGSLPRAGDGAQAGGFEARWPLADIVRRVRNVQYVVRCESRRSDLNQTAISSRTRCASISLPAPPVMISPRLITQ